MAFPGTISISAQLFSQLLTEIIQGLEQQGFKHIYFLNGHGANLEPLKACVTTQMAMKTGLQIRVRSWWDFDAVNALRQQYYGAWEGMHATPSEIAITQTVYRAVTPGSAATPPEKLPPAYIKAHAGDKHGPPEQHRAQFPDGRVGSHSALARPEHGEALLTAAIAAMTADYREFVAL